MQIHRFLLRNKNHYSSFLTDELVNAMPFTVTCIHVTWERG